MNTQEANEKQEGNQNKEAAENSMQKAEVNQEENSQTKEEKQPAETKDSPNYSINLAILGGVVGAGIGLLANPDTGKKLMKNLGESEFVKVAEKEFKKTAQELLAGQAQNSIRQLAEGYISKIDGKLLSPLKESGDNKGTGSSEKETQSPAYEKIKEENKELNERLQKMEKMLNDLAGTQK
ncbi:YtxH domain-containing protein [Domibacillus sp. PGB-M46]|uniref:YtxH domain-containing protein n=1 Tax=Domibacillus sp. PGB-M46 TaxID=2910255 RepID=UPI001F568EB2|nr:YtxH domain-containing protein [Domibacillus sp. PGB-M46]MCI2255401.1 YtxH domain-containing protein [Domibacillus sp. PGB-M46]